MVKPACLGTPTEVFYAKHPEQALAICATCPLKKACLAAAMEHEEPNNRYGVWGGTTPMERAVIAGEMDERFRPCVVCGKDFRLSLLSGRNRLTCSEACRKRRRQLNHLAKRTNAETISCS